MGSTLIFGGYFMISNGFQLGVAEFTYLAATYLAASET
jgi:hypothetical protein